MVLTKIDDRGLKTPIDLQDNEKIRLGTGNDLQIYHDGSHSRIDETGTGNLMIQSNNAVFIKKGTSENIAKFNVDGAVELYHNNNKKFETTSTGANVTSANDAVLQVTTTGTASTDDARIELITQESTFTIQNDRSLGTDGALTISPGSEAGVNIYKDGAVELYHNNSKKLETTSGGVDITGTMMADGIQLQDTHALNCGNSQDLQIFHDGNNSYIRENGTGSLYIDSNGNGVVLRGVQGEDSVVCNANGDVELYFNNVKQMETTSLGANIRNHHKFMTGTVTQRVFQNGNGICIRPNTSGAGGNNTQGTFISS